MIVKPFLASETFSRRPQLLIDMVVSWSWKKALERPDKYVCKRYVEYHLSNMRLDMQWEFTEDVIKLPKDWRRPQTAGMLLYVSGHTSNLREFTIAILNLKPSSHIEIPHKITCWRLLQAVIGLSIKFTDISLGLSLIYTPI